MGSYVSAPPDTVDKDNSLGVLHYSNSIMVYMMSCHREDATIRIMQDLAVYTCAHM